MTEELPRCGRCAAVARWSVCNLEGDAMDPIVRWLACGRHLHAVLDEGVWEVDCVQVYDILYVGDGVIGT